MKFASVSLSCLRSSILTDKFLLVSRNFTFGVLHTHTNVVNIAVKECLNMMRTEIVSSRSLINSIRASVKHRDLFEKVRIELGDIVRLPVMDVETR